MPTPADNGKLGGAKSKFVRGKSGTDMDIAAGTQRTRLASWSGVVLSSATTPKIITSSSKQNSGPTTSFVAERGSAVNITYQLSGLSPTHPPGTTPTPSPTRRSVIDVDNDSVGSGKDVEEVTTNKNSDVQDNYKLR
jgi:hypothetical protein